MKVMEIICPKCQHENPEDTKLTAEGGYQMAMRQAAEALAARSNRAYSMGIATLYTYAGEKDRALDWLEIAFQERMQNLVYLNVYPKWDPLRDDRRFQDLLRRMNFPPGYQ